MSILGIDLGGSRIKVGRVNEETVVSERTVSVDHDRSFDEHLRQLEPVLQELRDAGNDAEDHIRGIGLAFPGLVDRRTTTICSTNEKHEGACDTDLERWAEERFQLPIILENDARAALLGEWKHGAGRDEDNLLMVTLGTGFGSAVLLQGKLLTGPNRRAGVLGGHITVRFDGYECTCGNRGCVESETGEWNLPRVIRSHDQFSESRLARADELTYRTLMNVADSGDPIAEEILERRLAFIGRGVVNLIHAYDPRRVVLGGGVMNRPEVVLPAIKQERDQHAWTPGETVELCAAEHPDHAALFGLNVLFEHDIQEV